MHTAASFSMTARASLPGVIDRMHRRTKRYGANLTVTPPPAYQLVSAEYLIPDGVVEVRALRLPPKLGAEMPGTWSSKLRPTNVLIVAVGVDLAMRLASAFAMNA